MYLTQNILSSYYLNYINFPKIKNHKVTHKVTDKVKAD